MTLLIDGYYIDGYRGIPVYIKNVLNKIPISKSTILCIKNHTKISGELQSKCIVIRLPGVNYIIWEQVFIPIVAIIYRVNKVWCPANTVGLFLLLTKKKVIITVHDLMFMYNEFSKTHFKQRVGIMYRRFVWLFSKYFKKIDIISVSKCTANELVQMFKLKSTVIYHGISKKTERVQMPSQDIIHRLPQQFVLHLGGNCPSRGTAIALDAFKKCGELTRRGVKCVVLGQFYNSHLYKQYKSDNTFIFLDYVSDSDLLYLYQHCQLFLSTSIKEGFGFGPLEAIMSGAPTLVLKSEIADEILGNIGVSTVPKPLFADKIQELVLKDSHSDFSEACMNYYLWSKSVEKHQAILF